MGSLKRSKFKKITIRILAIITSIVIYRKVQNYCCNKYNVRKWDMSNDTSCYNSQSEDALPPVENVQMPSKSIFFIETSCKGRLNSRQACSVESAARTHPHWQINVLFCSPVSHDVYNHSCLNTLQEFGNVQMARIHVDKFINNTILAPILTKKFLRETKFPLNKMSNALRYLTLLKWPGIYLDTDVFVAKNLESLGPNWAAREISTMVNTAVLALSGDPVGKKMAADLLREYKKQYKENKWGMTGPRLITNLLKKKWCSTNKTIKFSAAVCQGFEVYNQSLIYPLGYGMVEKIFRSGYKVVEKSRAYTYHLWNRFTNNFTKIPYDSPYGTLARNLCPTIYNLFGDKFGS